MTSRTRDIPRGFTLIEVLIGILILAIALLGLGAVIPVVVKAQRQASDATQGLVAIEAAEGYLRNSAELNKRRANPLSANTSPANRPPASTPKPGPAPESRSSRSITRNTAPASP